VSAQALEQLISDSVNEIGVQLHGVLVGVRVGVGVTLMLGVLLILIDGVTVGVTVGVLVGVTDGVIDGVIEGVTLGVGVGDTQVPELDAYALPPLSLITKNVPAGIPPPVKKNVVAALPTNAWISAIVHVSVPSGT
jgi:hypothetical protein